jgi:transposase-like protein
MTAGALVAKTLLDAHADVLREALRVVLAQRMEAESRAKIGAAHGEVSDSRLTQRTG